MPEPGGLTTGEIEQLLASFRGPAAPASPVSSPPAQRGRTDALRRTRSGSRASSRSPATARAGGGLSSTNGRDPDRRPGRAQARSAPDRHKHPNTCPSAARTFRDDELAAALWVCEPLRSSLPIRPRAHRLVRRRGIVRRGVRGHALDDPLEFFDLRPYAERLSEAELNTGLGEAILVGQAAIDGHPVELAVMDFSFMGGSMGSAVGEKFSRACDSAVERGVPLVSVTSRAARGCRRGSSR